MKNTLQKALEMLNWWGSGKSSINRVYKDGKNDMGFGEQKTLGLEWDDLEVKY